MSGGGSSKNHKWGNGKSGRDDDDDDDRKDRDSDNNEDQPNRTRAAHQAKLAAVMNGFQDMNPIVQAQLNQGYGQQMQDTGMTPYGADPVVPPTTDERPSYTDWRQAQMDDGIERPYFDYLRGLTSDQRSQMLAGDLQTPWSGGSNGSILQDLFSGWDDLDMGSFSRRRRYSDDDDDDKWSSRKRRSAFGDMWKHDSNR